MKERSLIGMKKQVLDSLTIRYIASLEHENKIHALLIKEQQTMIELLEKEIVSLQEHRITIRKTE